MELSRHILKEFADVSRGVERENKTQYLRGTIKSSGEAKYVRIDGSESLTPISEIVDVKVGDRVLVTIENHEATILGNLTKPPSAYKEQEAIDKAENAQGAAGEAVEKAENAESLAQSAGNKADAALVDATNASASANQAKQDAAEAITAAGNASKNSTEAKQLATAAGQNAETARQEAALAQNAATAAQGEVTRIQGVVTDVQGDIDTALQEVANQAADLQATKETLEVTYAKKTEVSDVQASLTTEISKKVGELQTTVSQTYAAKNDVVDMEGRLQSQITQTSGEVSSVVGKVEKLESDTTEAQQKVDEALEKSAAAQVAAGQAQANATASQAAADAAKANADTATKKANEAAQNAATAAATAAEADRKVSAAKTDLDEAKQNLANTINRVGATEQEIAAAQQKVDAAQAAVTQAQKDAAEATAAANNAQNTANKAQTDATEAQNAATNAQKKAENAAIAAGNAQAAADKAQQDVAALTKRVTSAETAITQNTEQIRLSATKTEEIGTKLENLQVGGRNLLLKTGEFNTSKLSGVVGDSSKINLEKTIITDDDSPSGKAYRIRKYKKGTENINGGCYWVMQKQLVAGKKYTWSAYVRGVGTVDVFGPEQGGAKAVALTSTWTKVSHTFTANSNKYYQFTFYGISDFDLYLTDLMLEEGNTPTPWSPAPEDQQSQIDGINNNLSNNYYSKTQTDAAIKVASDNVTTTVRKEVTTEITNVNKKVDNLQVGGRNLWIINKTTTTGVKEKLPDNHITGQKECWRIGNTGSVQFFIEPEYSKRMYGKTFTFSAWIKYENVVQGTNYWNVFNIFKHALQYKNSTSGEATGIDYLTLDFMTGTSDWKKITYTHTYDRSGFDMLKNSFRFNIENAKSGTAWITGIKVEEGNKATDWTPAPEDQQAQIDNIKLGGRNLLLHSEVSEENMRYFEKQDAAAEVVKEGSLKYYKIKINDGVSGNNNGVRIANNYLHYNLTKGKHYIFSYWIKTNIDYGFAFNSIGHHQVANESNLHTEINNKYNVSSLTANKWTRVTIEFDTTVDAFFIPYIWFVEAGMEICVYGFMLEEGNKASGWTPAPEDMATAEQAQQAQNDANDANSKADSNEHRVSVAESTIKQLSDSISMMVTDSNGSSMMTQTSDGWTFNIGSITSAIDSAANNIDNLSGSLDQTKNVVNNLNNLANDLSKKTAYINMTTDETGAPCIELGKTGNAFKVRITNTSVDFIQGSSKIAYVSNQALFIEKAIIKSELQVGETKGFVWKTRSNGNMGLRWFGSV